MGRRLLRDDKFKLVAAIAAEGCIVGKLQFDDHCIFEVDDGTCNGGRQYGLEFDISFNLMEPGGPYIPGRALSGARLAAGSWQNGTLGLGLRHDPGGKGRDPGRVRRALGIKQVVRSRAPHKA